MNKKRNYPLPWRQPISMSSNGMLIMKAWQKPHIKYLKLWRLNLFTIKIEYGFLLNKSIRVAIFFFRIICFLFKNIQQRLHKLKINILVQLKQKNMSSKIFACSQANYLLQGKPLNEICNTKWKRWRRTKSEMKLDKVECKGSWTRLMETLMSTTRFPRHDKVGKINWKMSRWISCRILKGKPPLNIVIVSWMVQLKIIILNVS